MTNTINAMNWNLADELIFVEGGKMEKTWRKTIKAQREPINNHDISKQDSKWSTSHFREKPSLNNTCRKCKHIKTLQDHDMWLNQFIH